MKLKEINCGDMFSDDNGNYVKCQAIDGDKEHLVRTVNLFDGLIQLVNEDTEVDPPCVCLAPNDLVFTDEMKQALKDAVN